MMFASPNPMGHFSMPQMKVAGMTMAAVQMELERVKMMPGAMVEQHLECLNKLLEPLAVLQGPLGLQTWLGEVQILVASIKRRSFSGMPLMPRERQVLQWYSARWRELRGGPCDMGRPEAQIILMSMGELALF